MDAASKTQVTYRGAVAMYNPQTGAVPAVCDSAAVRRDKQQHAARASPPAIRRKAETLLAGAR